MVLFTVGMVTQQWARLISRVVRISRSRATGGELREGGGNLPSGLSVSRSCQPCPYCQRLNWCYHVHRPVESYNSQLQTAELGVTVCRKGGEERGRQTHGVAWTDGRQRTKKSRLTMQRWSSLCDDSAPVLLRLNGLRLITAAWKRISKGWNTNPNIWSELRKFELRLTSLVSTLS